LGLFSVGKKQQLDEFHNFVLRFLRWQISYRSKPGDLKSNRFCSDVYQIGVLAKLGDLNSVVDSSLFSFKSLGRFIILEILHLAEG
jgi:hypothetical protein